MVTKELITFIRKQQDQGRSKEQIMVSLAAAGGWHSTEIEAAFRYITRFARRNSPKVSWYSYGLTGFGMFIGAFLLAYYSYEHFFPEGYVAEGWIVFIAMSLIPVITLQFLNWAGHTLFNFWSKSIFVTGVSTALLFTMSFVTAFDVSRLTTWTIAILLIPIWLYLYVYVYEVPLDKAILIGILQLVLSLLALAIMAIGVGVPIFLKAFNIPTDSSYIQSLGVIPKESSPQKTINKPDFSQDLNTKQPLSAPPVIINKQ